MSVQLYAVTPAGSQPLPLSADVTGIHDLPDDLPLGVYTAFRTFKHNQFLNLTAHLDRLDESMALLGWTYRLEHTPVRRALHQLCTAYPRPEARVRLDVLAEAITVDNGPGRVLITLAPFAPIPPAVYENGVAVDLARNLYREQPRAKTTDFIVARRSYWQQRNRVYEYLLLNKDGRILEGSSSNFYAVRDGTLWTAGEGILEGVTREMILKLVEELNIPLQLEAPPLTELDRFEEAFISSSSRGIIPVVEIAGQPVGNARPGPLTHRLMIAYDQRVAATIRPAITSPGQSSN